MKKKRDRWDMRDYIEELVLFTRNCSNFVSILILFFSNADYFLYDRKQSTAGTSFEFAGEQTSRHFQFDLFFVFKKIESICRIRIASVQMILYSWNEVT